MKAYFVLFLSVLSYSISAQSIPKLIKIADELFEADRYLDAIEFYEKISGIDKQNHLAKFRLGYCYNKTLDYEKAKKTFTDLGAFENEFQARALYNYGNLLKLESSFENADSIYSHLIALPSADPALVELSRKQKEGCLLALRQKEEEKGYTISLMEDINSKFHDFGATLNPTTKELVLASTRNLPGVQYEGSQFEGVLPDLVAFELRDNGRWRLSTSNQNFSVLNTQWSEGSGSFTKDGNTFYFSSCRGDDGADCGIMVSYRIDGRWTEPISLNEYINEPGSENKQPAISFTGDTLFFSSDRPGGIGASDIWMSLKGIEAESWSPAINLGDVINSPEEDITPYYSSAFGCLLFSSNGHIGYGGYDIYAAKGESFFEPEVYNLGHPFNSTLDDTYFAISDSVGYISSNREDNRNLNLYSFNVPNERLYLSLLISGESLIDTRIISKFRDIRSLDLVTFRVEDYQGYELFDPVKRNKPKPKLIADAEAAAEQQRKADSVAALGITAEVTLANTNESRSSGGIDGSTSAYRVSYETQYFGYGHVMLRSEAKKSLDDLANQLRDKEYSMVNVLAYTDHLGTDSFNIELSNKRGKAIMAYLALRGVPLDKIRILARGELKPEGDKDHIFRRIFSRKVEIVVDADQPLQLKSAKAFVVVRENTPEVFAEELGVKTEDLISWNGIRENTIAVGNTIRIFDPSERYSSKLLMDELGARDLARTRTQNN